MKKGSATKAKAKALKAREDSNNDYNKDSKQLAISEQIKKIRAFIDDSFNTNSCESTTADKNTISKSTVNDLRRDLLKFFAT